MHVREVVGERNEGRSWRMPVRQFPANCNPEVVQMKIDSPEKQPGQGKKDAGKEPGERVGREERYK